MANENKTRTNDNNNVGNDNTQIITTNDKKLTDVEKELITVASTVNMMMLMNDLVTGENTRLQYSKSFLIKN